ncbi:DNA sulfur modification protein DndD [Natroniella sulfidigena]|uniref:DNA sulfur modification protein DndD n=1 Tax=Natroniella sulfidigena TaxID=723921 RepID=UPI00200A3962|nr:DNA sulfur modification protein DndD [Natroniella sulfidigena]MCK8817159.1 DNA sulfur modification protein DndD [Natroniella sulfidigena]
MEINKLQLYNFGIYYGKHEMDFNLSSKEKNVILISGENGSGKTTLLDAVNLVLYGSLILGTKTNTSRYINYIKERINYSALEDDTKMYLTLDFNLNKHGNKKRYIMKREWYFEDNIEENLIIKDQDKELTQEEINKFQDYIRTVFPPSLFEFFLFDGENMGNLLYTEDFRKILEGSSKTIFNLNLIKELNDDLDTLLKEKIEDRSLSKIEQEYKKITEKYKKLKNKLKNKQNKLKNIKEKIEASSEKKEALEEEFDTYGGLFAEERKKINEEINKLKLQKEEAKSFLDNYYQNILPFSCCTRLLSNIIKQVKKENVYKNYMNVKNKLDNELPKKLNQDIKQSQLEITDENKNDRSQDLIKILLDNIDQSFKPNFDTENFNLIHKLSSSEEQKLVNKIKTIINFNEEKALEKIEKINNINLKLNKLNKRLKHNQESSELNNLLKEIEKCIMKKSKLEKMVEEIKEEIDLIKDDLETLSKDKKKKLKEWKNSKKVNNIPILCDKLNNVLSKYTEIQTKKKLKLVENKFLEIINNLISVENYIKNIEINPTTFKVNLYSKNNDLLTNLSAGEQELVILALLWSLMEVSKQKFPLILDTLLGRIDEKHRENIIKNLLIKADLQIIILAINSELNNIQYKALKPYIERNYLINKVDKLNNRSTIEENTLFVGDNNEVPIKNFG